VVSAGGFSFYCVGSSPKSTAPISPPAPQPLRSGPFLPVIRGNARGGFTGTDIVGRV
jgi:hypothetical protein